MSDLVGNPEDQFSHDTQVLAKLSTLNTIYLVQIDQRCLKWYVHMDL